MNDEGGALRIAMDDYVAAWSALRETIRRFDAGEDVTRTELVTAADRAEDDLLAAHALGGADYPSFALAATNTRTLIACARRLSTETT